jgi:hypothetical protein
MDQRGFPAEIKQADPSILSAKNILCCLQVQNVQLVNRTIYTQCDSIGSNLNTIGLEKVK